MRVLGVIAEYDPFHNGHAWHLAQARAQAGADAVVCVMSGAFTQRGMPALFSAHDRARMALEHGADIVLSPPCAFSVCDGERFALGGVAVLQGLGAVDCLGFGVEAAGVAIYEKAAEWLDAPPAGHCQAVRAGLDKGLSFARAQGEALAGALGVSNAALAAPNTALAICYARAVRKLGAGFAFTPVVRRGDYHAEGLADSAAPSASAIRRAALAGDWENVERCMPEKAYIILRRAFADGRVHRPESLDDLLRLTLRQGGDFSNLPSAAEGLENRLRRAAMERTRDDMVNAVKSKRYTYARVNRLLTEALLGMNSHDIPPLPPYAYILGFKRSAAPLLRKARDNGMALRTRIEPGDGSPLSRLDARADDVWLLGAGLPFGGGYRAKPVII